MGGGMEEQKAPGRVMGILDGVFPNFVSPHT